MPPRPPRVALAAAAVTLLAPALIGPPASATTQGPEPTSSGGVTVTDARVPVGAEPDGSTVTLDTSVFAPSSSAADSRGKHPSLLLAHGFGGSKADLEERARAYAADGYVVLTYTARGFGDSAGRIHLNDPAHEIKDAQALIDVLAARPDVHLDGPGDPRVGIVGGSYGGALGLMTGSVDQRVDTVVAAITWNDLSTAFFPQHAVTTGDPASGADVTPIPEPGVFKQLWASRFFLGSVGGASGGSRGGSSGEPRGNSNDSLLCGRFDLAVCTPFLAAAETGTPDPALLAMLRAHSPAPHLKGLRAPTFLVQGMSDSLFGLDQADATARTLLAQSTPTAVRWVDGGHDGVSSTQVADDEAVTTWLDHYLGADRPQAGELPVPAFTWAAPIPRRADSAPLFTAPAYDRAAGPDASHVSWEPLPMRQLQSTQELLNPPGGEPRSMTMIPGAAELGVSLPTYQLSALPGQSVAFDSLPVPKRLDVAGSPRVTIRVTATGKEATLFASLWQVQGNSVTLPRSLVAPVRLTLTPGQTREVTIALPAATYTMNQGSTWRVLLTSTDSGLAGPTRAAGYRVELAGDRIEIPVRHGTREAGAANGFDTEFWGVVAALALLLLAVAGGAWWRRRTAQHRPQRADLAGVPLVVENLVKTYADGHRAVDDVSWRAEKGQVVGLLGPNGAGKTTTMRMLLGLITPDSGSVHILGQPLTPGSEVLRHVGALVEGPGFLPHLTGRENLEAYWAATGRPFEEAGFDEALSVAALGGALERPARTYSHGMKQRLGIAQAMLGRPELLFLDEPTNGLDPPQIAAMRPILQAYAATGRTVVVSSHLLAEVEMTCSHVVVMHAGRVITTGTVADLVASEDTTVFECAPDPTVPLATAVDHLTRQDGIRSVEVHDDEATHRVTVVADLPRAEVVRAALDSGLDVVGVGSRRHLEEVFLGAIAGASTPDAADPGVSGQGAPGQGSSMLERLRQVRPR